MEKLKKNTKLSRSHLQFQKTFVIFNGVRFLRKFQMYKEQEYGILYASTLISSVRVLNSLNCGHLKPGGGGGTWVNFCWVFAAGLSEPLTLL